VRCAVFVITNEKNKKHILFLLRRKFTFASKNNKICRSLFCHCSARVKLFKKKTPNYPACRTNCMQDNISVRPLQHGSIIFLLIALCNHHVVAICQRLLFVSQSCRLKSHAFKCVDGINFDCSRIAPWLQEPSNRGDCSMVNGLRLVVGL
jgi:hypothetical protein